MNRQERRQKFTLSEVERIREEALKVGYTKAVAYIYAGAFLVLHDKFGFDKEKCKEFARQTDNQVDCLNKQMLTYEDLKKCVEDEMGVKIV